MKTADPIAHYSPDVPPDKASMMIDHWMSGREKEWPLRPRRARDRVSAVAQRGAEPVAELRRPLHVRHVLVPELCRELIPGGEDRDRAGEPDAVHRVVHGGDREVSESVPVEVADAQRRAEEIL